MNAYVEWRLNEFKEYFYSHDKNWQLSLISGYYSSSISNILSGRKYCEFLAYQFIENIQMSVWINTFNELVDEIEEFFKKKETKLYPTWQRKVLAFLERKIRIAKAH